MIKIIDKIFRSYAYLNFKYGDCYLEIKDRYNNRMVLKVYQDKNNRYYVKYNNGSKVRPTKKHWVLPKNLNVSKYCGVRWITNPPLTK